MSKPCKRCGIQVSWKDGRFSDDNGMPHHITRCSTRPKHVWCPRCMEAFPMSSVCEHYKELKYVPGETEDFFIGRILSTKRAAAASTSRPDPCKTCGADLSRLDAARRKTHEKIHEHSKNNQSAMADYF